MKICSKCRESKPLTEYTANRRASSGFNHNCRTCQRVYTKRHYNENKAAYLARNRRYRPRRRQLLHQPIAAAKDVPCTDCKRRYPSYVMDLDHVRGKKLFGLGNYYSHTLAQIRAELKKCEAVCANCHRVRTYGRSRRST